MSRICHLGRPVWPTGSLCFPPSTPLQPSTPSAMPWLLGIQPTLTQVPPTPQVVPWGDGFTKSATATRLKMSLAIEAMTNMNTHNIHITHVYLCFYRFTLNHSVRYTLTHLYHTHHSLLIHLFDPSVIEIHKKKKTSKNYVYCVYV